MVVSTLRSESVEQQQLYNIREGNKEDIGGRRRNQTVGGDKESSIIWIVLIGMYT